MNRRDFVKGAALAAFAGMSGESRAAKAEGCSVKFCVFSDLHYWPHCYSHDSTEFLDAIIARAKAEKVDFIVHLGDMVHNCKKYKDFIDRYLDCGLPAYYCLGNHEDEQQPHEVNMEMLRLKKEYYFFDVKGFRFIVTDPHYILRDGQLVHFSNSNWRVKNKRPSDRIYWIPPDQLKWLRETIDASPHPCVVMAHESYERPGAGGVQNQEEVRAIFDAANAKTPGKVRLVMTGHYHVDFLRVLRGIAYLEVNSANYFFAGKRHDKYPADYLKAHGGAHETYIYDKPLSSIITLYDSGRIKIDGAKANFWMGITPQMGGHSGYDSARQATAESQSLDFNLLGI